MTAASSDNAPSRPQPKPGRAVVLGRLRAGRPVAEQAEAAAGRLRGRGWRVRVVLVRRKRELRQGSRRAVRDGIDLLVVAGGDGAVLQVLNALAGSRTLLGIVPLGTGNLVASNLGLPRDANAAIEVLATGVVRQVDLGRARLGGRTWHFAVACGAGIDAAVMGATDADEKRTFGRLAYVAEAVRAARSIREARFRLRADGRGERGRAAQVLVANLGRVAGIEPRDPIDPADGRLELFVARAASAGGVVAAIVEGLLTSPDSAPGGRVSRRSVRKVRIASTPRLPVEVDGTAVGRTPVRVDVRPGALRVLVPPEP